VRKMVCMVISGATSKVNEQLPYRILFYENRIGFFAARGFISQLIGADGFGKRRK
jgi:hypothetical protein